MKHLLSLFLLTFFFSILLSAQQKSGVYFPPAGSWEQRSPSVLGINATILQEAIALAKAGESKNPRSMEINHYRTFGKEPFGEGIGPFADRGEATGVIVYKGYIVARWGEPLRCDMTHSVTKSFLSAVVGVAVDHGLIKDVNDTVTHYIPPIEWYDPKAAINRAAEDIGKPQLLFPLPLHIIVRLHGMTYSDKPAIGKEHFGVNPIGQTDQMLMPING